MHTFPAFDSSSPSLTLSRPCGRISIGVGLYLPLRRAFVRISVASFLCSYCAMSQGITAGVVKSYLSSAVCIQNFFYDVGTYFSKEEVGQNVASFYICPLLFIP